MNFWINPWKTKQNKKPGITNVWFKLKNQMMGGLISCKYFVKKTVF